MTNNQKEKIQKATNVAEQIILNNLECLDLNGAIETVDISINILRVLKEAADELILNHEFSN